MCYRSQKSNGFTLLELLVAVTIIGVLGAIAIPSYSAYADRSSSSSAASDIQRIQLAIDRFNANTFGYPDSLADLNIDLPTDPWGAPYTYLRIDGSADPGVRGKQRKDKNLNPLNSDYDLFSAGKDQKTRGPLTARDSRDDIVRAGNGGYIGLAEYH